MDDDVRRDEKTPRKRWNEDGRMQIMIRTDDRNGSNADRLPVLVRLRNWLIGPPPGTVLPPKGEDEEAARKRREIEQLDPAGLANQISKVMWAQRGSLKVVAGSNDYERRGLHSGHERKFSVEMPGGISMTFDEKCDSFFVRSPEGETESFRKPEASRIGAVWRAIQALAICDAMGVVVPEGEEGIRPSAVLKALDSAVCAIVERGEPPRADAEYEIRSIYRASDHEAPWQKTRSEWRDLGCGVFLDPTERKESYYERDVADPRWYRLMTAEMGTLLLRREALAEALERRKRSSFANALGLARALPAHLPMPSGNAQAARVLRLCREAVAREPELIDAKGTPIAPLVEQHLPRLMSRHAEAARIAETSELAAIDAELMEGIERVRLAVEEALVVSRVDKREALRTELAFLEYRHPSPSVLSLDAPEESA
jgi:uncharacterized protein YbaA (DUF1428 family)